MVKVLFDRGDLGRLDFAHIESSLLFGQNATSERNIASVDVPPGWLEFVTSQKKLNLKHQAFHCYISDAHHTAQAC